MRHLRDGALPEALACATVCILDDLQTCGGLEVLQQVRVLSAGPALPWVHTRRQGSQLLRGAHLTTPSTHLRMTLDTLPDLFKNSRLFLRLRTP